MQAGRAAKAPRGWSCRSPSALSRGLHNARTADHWRRTTAWGRTWPARGRAGAVDPTSPAGRVLRKKTPRDPRKALPPCVLSGASPHVLQKALPPRPLREAPPPRVRQAAAPAHVRRHLSHAERARRRYVCHRRVGPRAPRRRRPPPWARRWPRSLRFSSAWTRSARSYGPVAAARVDSFCRPHPSWRAALWPETGKFARESFRRSPPTDYSGAHDPDGPLLPSRGPGAAEGRSPGLHSRASVLHAGRTRGHRTAAITERFGSSVEGAGHTWRLSGGFSTAAVVASALLEHVAPPSP